MSPHHAQCAVLPREKKLSGYKISVTVRNAYFCYVEIMIVSESHAISSKSVMTTAVSKPPIFVSEAWRLMPV